MICGYRFERYFDQLLGARNGRSWWGKKKGVIPSSIFDLLEGRGQIVIHADPKQNLGSNETVLESRISLSTSLVRV